MNSQLFYVLNFAIGALIFFWFMSGRKKSSHTPTKLKLKGDKSPFDLKKVNLNAVPKNYSEIAKKLNEQDEVSGLHNIGRQQKEVQKGNSSNRSENFIQKKEKNLNVFFVYNGHSWDAHEVLGVPAGAKLSLITERYQSMIKNADSGKHEFLEAAYKAILDQMGRA